MSGKYKLVVMAAIIQIAHCLVSWDPACGVSKGCFPDCRNQGCEYLITWQNAGMSSLQFTMMLELTPAPGYLAFGLSNDYRMGEDSGVACMTSTGQCYTYYNKGTDSDILAPSNLGISQFAYSAKNGIIQFNVTRQLALSTPNDRFFDISHNQYILMLVYGVSKEKKGNIELGKHPMIPHSSDGVVDFEKRQIVGLRKLNTPVIKLHGIVMTLAWLLFSCIGIVTARYNKLMLKQYKLFGTQIWFQVHRGIMVFVIGLCVIGFISIFVDIGGYSQLTPPSSLAVTSAHPVLGIIVTVLSLFNLIGGFIRPANDHQWRWLFNWGHFLMGVLIQILAVSTVLIGYRMERAMLPMSVLYVGITQLVLTIAVCTTIEIHRWRVKRSQDSLHGSSFDPVVIGGKLASEIYFYTLVAYGAIMLGLTFVTIVLIDMS